MESDLPSICIHGHFYQPPREDPRTGDVPIQPSAAPFQNWNHQITAECYRPLLHVPIRGVGGRLIDQINGWEHLSFDVGPTLMRWLHQQHPQVHNGIVRADRASVDRLGHGNAIAQGYHHAILPLCNERDRQTELRWGIADFQARFSRDPEGIWLPETAVDTPTLEAVADEGLHFVLLAPHQAAAGEEVDTTCAYRVPLDGERELAAFFYDGAAARGVAFEGWLHNGVAMAERLAAGSGLVHLATDGESYGHHHRHGEMALAYAIHSLTEQALPPTNYAAWLAHNPATRAMGIVERSSWSCAHGVGRWSADCGCGTDQGAWRAVLRAGLNALRDAIDEWSIPRIAASGEDPWAMRDHYVHHLLAEEGIRTGLDPLLGTRDQDLPRLLRIQELRLMMFTSCGWFFGDPTGLETTQILAYARHAVERVIEAGGPDLSELLPIV